MGMNSPLPFVYSTLIYLFMTVSLSLWFRPCPNSLFRFQTHSLPLCKKGQFRQLSLAGEFAPSAISSNFFQEHTSLVALFAAGSQDPPL